MEISEGVHITKYVELSLHLEVVVVILHQVKYTISVFFCVVPVHKSINGTVSWAFNFYQPMGIGFIGIKDQSIW